MIERGLAGPSDRENSVERVEHEVHSLGFFIGEGIEDLTHADSRLWRTLVALMFKPGFLTREYFAGRRGRDQRSACRSAASRSVARIGTDTRPRSRADDGRTQLPVSKLRRARRIMD